MLIRWPDSTAGATDHSVRLKSNPCALQVTQKLVVVQLHRAGFDADVASTALQVYLPPPPSLPHLYQKHSHTSCYPNLLPHPTLACYFDLL